MQSGNNQRNLREGTVINCRDRGSRLLGVETDFLSVGCARRPIDGYDTAYDRYQRSARSRRERHRSQRAQILCRRGTGGVGLAAARIRADGSGAHRPYLDEAEPTAWLRLPGLRVAGNTRSPETCRILRERRQAVAEEATTRTVDPGFFARHSVPELLARTDYWLGRQGRLTHPMIIRPGSLHYEPIDWDDAYAVIAEHLRALPDPNEAIFYTSGRTSNEAAFLYQLMIRSFGTNNMPDCSNMCHESSGTALSETIGIGKGSVSVTDLEHADLILIAGQNPGTNHPRMLSVLEKAKARGAKVIAINPLPEAGLLRFKDPQKARGVLGEGVAIADEFLQIRLGGDQALFQGLAKLLLAAEDRAPGTVLDRDFLDRHCAGFEQWATHIRAVDLDTVSTATGLSRSQLEDTAAALVASRATIICWAMGLTQHPHAVATIEDAVALLLMRGMIGTRGAGVCPVRGHSNVQGDRTMAYGRKPPSRSCRPSIPSSGFAVPASTVTTRSTRSAPCATARRRCSWPWAVTSCLPPPTPR